MALTGHSKEVMSVNMHGKLCVSVGQDNQLIIYRINNYYYTAEILFKMPLESDQVN